MQQYFCAKCAKCAKYAKHKLYREYGICGQLQNINRCCAAKTCFECSELKLNSGSDDIMKTKKCSYCKSGNNLYIVCYFSSIYVIKKIWKYFIYIDHQYESQCYNTYRYFWFRNFEHHRGSDRPAAIKFYKAYHKNTEIINLSLYWQVNGVEYRDNDKPSSLEIFDRNLQISTLYWHTFDKVYRCHHNGKPSSIILNPNGNVKDLMWRGVNGELLERKIEIAGTKFYRS